MRNDGVNTPRSSFDQSIRSELDRLSSITHIIDEDRNLSANSNEYNFEQGISKVMRTLFRTSPTRISIRPSTPGASPFDRFLLIKAKSTSSRSAKVVALQ